MKLTTPLAALALGALAVFFALAPARDAGDAGDLDAPALRERLLGIERGLRANEASVPSDRREARSRALDELHRYAVAGVFPHNHESTAARPIFVDSHGTLCAVANLLAFSGRRAFVDRVARTRNDARVADLASQPEMHEMVRWSRETGITLAEAATIQAPSYRFEAPPRERTEPNPVTEVARTGALVAAGVFGFLFVASGLQSWRLSALARAVV
jgi:hypothetical protein